MSLKFKSSSLLMIIFFCLCMHACIARHLANRDFDKQHFAVKVVVSVDDSNQHGAKNGGAHTSKPKESKAFLKGGNSGSEIVESSSHVGLQKATEIEGSKWPASHDKEEVIDPNTYSVKEGIIETDYEPPQRKTPVHNK